MVRVLHVFAGMNTGGVESFAINLQEAFKDENIRFDFLLRRQDNDKDKIRYFKSHGSKIYLVRPWPQDIVGNYRGIRKFFIDHGKEYDYAHIHMNALIYMLPAKLALSCLNGGKVILHSHNTKAAKGWMRIIHNKNKRWLQKHKVIRLACSEEAGKWMFGDGYKVIPNAIDVRRYMLAREDLERREKGIVSLVSVGRVERQKNYSFMISVIKQLIQDGVNVKYYIAGEGSKKKELMKAVEKNGLADKIIFLGNVKDIPELLKSKSIFCMPSLYEGFSISLLEAESSGLPSVIADNISMESALCKNVYRIPLEKARWVEQIKKLAKMENMGFDSGNNDRIAGSQYGLGGLKASMESIYK